MNLTISTNWSTYISYPKKMRVFQNLHKDHATDCQINKKPKLSFFPPPKSNIKLRRLAISEGKTNSHPIHLKIWYHIWPKKGHLTKKWQTNSTISLQKNTRNTTRINYNSSWKKIVMSRNPILKQLPRENIYLERRLKLPHLYNKLHNIYN